jgi:hypothetical protein
MTKVRVELVDRYGKELPMEAYDEHPVSLVSISFWPNNDPDDPSEDELYLKVESRKPSCARCGRIDDLRMAGPLGLCCPEHFKEPL